ncbi:hypothetical protein AUP68_11916 [Ilyonectria robusta]
METACHLRHHTARPTAHEIAECHQQRATLQGFLPALHQRLDQSRSDALLTTAMFLNLLAVAFVDDARLSASWVVGSDRGRLGWLELQLGLKPLLMATSRLRDASALQPCLRHPTMSDRLLAALITVSPASPRRGRRCSGRAPRTALTLPSCKSRCVS